MKDHFSSVSADYAHFRPRYPLALVDALADAAPATRIAWDVGCGTGQLSVPLARRFSRVRATDASRQQIEQAEPHPGVEYLVAPADRSGADANSVDVSIAAQAAHWFDLESFYAEVRRVAVPDGVIALATYGLLSVAGGVDAVVHEFYSETLAPYWPIERRHVDARYRTLPFPFTEIPIPPLAMTARWTLRQFLGYVQTWSALRAAERALGRSPLPQLEASLAAEWGDDLREVRWPLTVRAGRVEAP